MSEIRERLEVHRHDALILLREVTQTATLHSGFRLAGAVSHIARAQVLLAEELDNLPSGPKTDEAATKQEGRTAAVSDTTPVDGLRL